MPASSHRAASFQTLAEAYIRRRLPDARPIDIANAVQALRERIDCGELRIDAVMHRLRSETGLSSAKAPTSFGDIARACRDLDGGLLTPRERAFVHQMVALGFNARPSQRQADWLSAIFARSQRRAA